MLLSGGLFAQQTCPSGTVPITTAGATQINNQNSYGFCLNAVDGSVVINSSVYPITINTFGCKSFPGFDNSECLQDAVSSGQSVYVPAGTYEYSVSGLNPICTRWQGQSSYLSTLKYTGTSGTALTETCFTHFPGYGLFSLTLEGNGKGANSATGLQVGTMVNTQFGEAFQADGIQVKGFHLGLNFASNTWVTRIDNSYFDNNDIDMSLNASGVSNAGENMTFSGDAFFDDSTYNHSCVNIGFGQVTFNQPSFDGCVVNINNFVYVTMNEPHFEDTRLADVPAINLVDATLRLNQAQIVYDVSPSAGSFAFENGSHLLIDGWEVDMGGMQIPLISATNTSYAYEYLGHYANSPFTNPCIVDGSSNCVQGPQFALPNPCSGTVSLVSGTIGVVSANCILTGVVSVLLDRQVVNSSTAIGQLSVASLSSSAGGISFTINSLSAINTVVAGDLSTVVWTVKQNSNL